MLGKKHIAKKAIVMARVSSAEQADNYSIPSQLKALREYCERQDLEIIKEYELVESSTRGDREEFYKMIDFAKEQNEIIAIVSYAVDRFQRRHEETIIANELVSANKIELAFYTNNLVINSQSQANDIFQWDIAVVMARNYTRLLSDNVKRGMNEKVLSGMWPSKAPIGYKNYKEEGSKPTVIIDESRALIIKRLFQYYSTGDYSITGHLMKLCKEWGLKSNQGGNYLSGQAIRNIISNPFYCGTMIVKGERFPHIHDRIITKALFDKCQIIMNARSNKKQVSRVSKHDFIFEGLLTCANSNRKVSSDLKVKPSGKEYIYLNYWNAEGKKKYINQNEIIKQVEGVFDRLEIPNELLNSITSTLKASHKAEQRFYEERLRSLNATLKRNKQKKDTLLDKLLDKRITDETYNQKQESLENEDEILKEEIIELDEIDKSFTNTLITIALICSKAGELFKSSKNEQKRRLLSFMFSNLMICDGSLCFILRKPFDALVDLTDYQSWLGYVDSNHGSRDQNPLPYRLAIPQNNRDQEIENLRD